MTTTNFDRLEGIPEGTHMHERAELQIDLTMDTWDRAGPMERLAVGFMIAGAGGNVAVVGGRTVQERDTNGGPLIVLVSLDLTIALSLLAARQLVRFCEGPDTPKEARSTARLIAESVATMEEVVRHG
jgi:hypothetical protein